LRVQPLPRSQQRTQRAGQRGIWIGISSRTHAKDQRSEDNEGVLHDRHLQLEMSLRIQQRRRLGKVGVITTSMLSSLFPRRASPWPCWVDIDAIPRQVFSSARSLIGSNAVRFTPRSTYFLQRSAIDPRLIVGDDFEYAVGSSSAFGDPSVRRQPRTAPLS